MKTGNRKLLDGFHTNDQMLWVRVTMFVISSFESVEFYHKIDQLFTSEQHLFSLITIGLHVSTVILSSSGPSQSCKSQGAVRTLGSQMCLH